MLYALGLVALAFPSLRARVCAALAVRLPWALWCLPPRRVGPQRPIALFAASELRSRMGTCPKLPASTSKMMCLNLPQCGLPVGSSPLMRVDTAGILSGVKCDSDCRQLSAARPVLPEETSGVSRPPGRKIHKQTNKYNIFDTWQAVKPAITNQLGELYHRRASQRVRIPLDIQVTWNSS
jgi:hypothetical protein